MLLDFITSPAFVTGVVTIIVTLITQRVASRLGKYKEESERKKTIIDAEDGLRDDLMSLLEKANNKIAEKDQIIDQLKEDVLALKSENRELRWESTLKTHQIEQQNQRITQQDQKLVEQSARIAELEAAIRIIKEQLGTNG